MMAQGDSPVSPLSDGPRIAAFGEGEEKMMPIVSAGR